MSDTQETLRAQRDAAICAEQRAGQTRMKLLQIFIGAGLGLTLFVILAWAISSYFMTIGLDVMACETLCFDRGAQQAKVYAGGAFSGERLVCACTSHVAISGGKTP